MKRRALPAALLVTAGLVIGAYGPASAATAPSAVPSGGVTTPAVAASDHNAQDVMFARMMIPHHRQAVEMSALATGRASSERVTRLAERIRAAQAPEIRTMSGWLTSWGEPVPSGPVHHDMPGMMSAEDMRHLEGLSGPAFDRAFLEMMIRHHEGAVAMARDELAHGSYGPATRLAASIVAGQSAEIAEMRRLLA